MFNFSSSRKLFVGILVLLLVACEKYCMDIDFINEKSEEFNTWFLDTTLTDKQLISSIGISDAVTVNPSFRDYGDSTWDDCDQVSQRLESSSNYLFNVFPFQLKIQFDNFGDKDGFEFSVNYDHYRDFRNFYKSHYKFVSEKTNARNPTTLVQNFECQGQFYEEALEVRFNRTNLPTEISRIYVVKEIGIVKIILNNETVLYLSPN